METTGQTDGKYSLKSTQNFLLVIDQLIHQFMFPEHT